MLPGLLKQSKTTEFITGTLGDFRDVRDVFLGQAGLWQWLPLAASIYAKSKKQHTLMTVDFKR